MIFSAFKLYFSNLINRFWAQPKAQKRAVENYNFIANDFAKLKVKNNTESNVLLVVNADDIGDYLLFSQAFNAFLNHPKTKQYQVYLLVNSVCKVLVQQIHNNCNFIFLNKAEWFNNHTYRLSFAQELIGLNPQKVLFPSLTRVPLLEGLLGSLFEPNKVYAWQRNVEQFDVEEQIKQLNSAAHLLPYPTKQTHELALNASFFSWFLSDNSLKPLDGFTFVFEPIFKEEPYILFAIGGNQKSKRYSIKQYRKIAEFIHRNNPKIKLVAIGSKQEEEFGNLLTQGLPNALNYCGKTDLLELMGLCKHALLLVGNDTGAAHMAALQKTKTIVLANGNRFGRFFPYPGSFENVYAVYTPRFNKIRQNKYNYNGKTLINTIPASTINQLVAHVIGNN